jgi:Na+(H+)/acetate symporter ActP
MEDRVVFFIGALVGGLVASGWYIIYQHWKSSKNLRSSSEKADKEALEKRQKAREDRRKSLAMAARAIIELILLGLVIIVAFAIILNLLS